MYKTRISFIIISLLVYGVFGAEASSFNENFRSFILDETETATKPVTIDGVSQQCMSCHNGSLGSHIQIKDATRPMQFSSFGSRAHPVGMQYVNYAAQRPHSFRERATLNPQIQLIDGRVGCLSCHKVKQNKVLATAKQNTTDATINTCTPSKTLTVGPRYTDLCLSCHIK